MSLLDNVCEFAAKSHPRGAKPFMEYGTAGFRSRAENMGHVFFRTGLLAVLRSKKLKAAVGLMVTASHNPEDDNGIKLIDPSGEMLHQSWEEYATKLANCSDVEVAACLHDIITTQQIDLMEECLVLIGQDTRRSSPALAVCAVQAIQLLVAKHIDFGLLTTPQLHFIVRCTNYPNYGSPTEEGYYMKLGAAFNELTDRLDSNNYSAYLHVDAANGVGGLKLQTFAQHLRLQLHIHNDGSTGTGLNEECGADYVKIQQTYPKGLTDVSAGIRCCSLDGDADRVVFFYKDKDGIFHLLDGDKIATLVAGQLKDLLARSGLQMVLGVVQTAYANGSSTKYLIDKLKLPVECVPTGVKHLHHKAQEFDIGIYFEANGHGTVLFSDSAAAMIQELSRNMQASADGQAAAKELRTLMDLVNQTVGDAISDLLLVEYILCARDWTVEDWDSLYQDVPCRQVKVCIADRGVIETTDAERHVVAPPGIQEAIDLQVLKYPQGRCFVRPSGTEDVVRVYSEASTQADADSLAAHVCVLVYDIAHGVGPRPQVPQ